MLPYPGENFSTPVSEKPPIGINGGNGFSVRAQPNSTGTKASVKVATGSEEQFRDLFDDDSLCFDCRFIPMSVGKRSHWKKD